MPDKTFSLTILILGILLTIGYYIDTHTSCIHQNMMTLEYRGPYIETKAVWHGKEVWKTLDPVAPNIDSLLNARRHSADSVIQLLNRIDKQL